jgi:hypothetical protein
METEAEIEAASNCERSEVPWFGAQDPVKYALDRQDGTVRLEPHENNA